MDSRSPRRPSLKPAWQPGIFRRLQPQPDFQSVRNLPALAGSLQQLRAGGGLEYLGPHRDGRRGGTLVVGWAMVQRAEVMTMSKRIAILGWGSLLWDGDDHFDRWHDAWKYDGPSLRLEFSRVSSSRLGALTLVIDPQHGSETTVAWCLSKRKDADDAVADLRCAKDVPSDTWRA